MDIGNLMSANEETLNQEALSIKYLTFVIDKNSFAVPIADVVSILQMQEIVPVPEFPPYAKGVINIRNEIFPVVDVRIRLCKPEKEYTGTTCIIMVNINSQQVGLIVDAVSEVTDILYDKISAPPQGFSKDDVNSYLIGVANHNEQVILIIDSQKVVYDDDKNVIFG